jgi:hypothetical protein
MKNILIYFVFTEYINEYKDSLDAEIMAYITNMKRMTIHLVIMNFSRNNKLSEMKLEIFTVMKIQVVVFCNVTPCSGMI